MTTSLRALGVSLVFCVGVVPAATAAPQDCRAPTPLPEPGIASNDDVVVTADSAEVTDDGLTVFRGSVRVTQGVQEVEASEVIYNNETSEVRIKGRATYREPGFEISANDANFDSTTHKASFSDAEFEVPSRPASGAAGKIEASGRGKLRMDEVVYTTCLGENPDWELRARDLDLNLRESHGTARKVVLDFKGVPIAYLPYISFPLDDSRKSGFLFPEIATSDRSGTEISVPYYWNIAPNYDATITPRYLSDRGLQLNSEFRYLTTTSAGEVGFEYLPNDDRSDGNRRLSRWQNVTRLSDEWRASVDLQEVSDRSYFEDLGRGTDMTSQTHLLRDAEFAYLGETWQFLARARNYQTIDSGISDADKPYEQLPQIVATSSWDDGPLGLSFGLTSELIDFNHEVDVEGLRVMVEPDVSLPVEGPGYFLVPKLAWRHTRYDLSRTDPGTKNDPTMTAPIASIDGGLLFERDTDNEKFVQTLEPRVLYAYIPSRNQDDIPLFDTGDPDFNMVQLYRTNRYVGGDRLGDTNQISYGVTTRLLDAITGREFLTATLGQAYYLSNRSVTLAGERTDSDSQSDLVAEIGLDIFRNWNADFGYQWDVGDNETSLAEARVQYRPAANKVANLSYRYRPGILEQAEASIGWPVSARWSLVGSLEYSLRDNSTIDRLVGVQYESCCWALRLASRRQISNRDGTFDTSVLLQLEFKGLAGVGADARKRFEGDILGYSVYQ